jgi:thioredoxin reductase (NADPH)
MSSERISAATRSNGQKPAIVIVDDEPAVLAAIGRDIQRHYGDRFRRINADSGLTALDVLRQLKLRDAPVALLLVDQRMPQMTGVELLAEAVTLYPDVKRVLLTAYADTEAAIRAINDVKLDHYLLKPWSPPEENLYPVLDDVLEDWLASYAPSFEGIRIIGTRWSAETFRIKDFLARNLVPYRSLDIERDEQARELLEFSGTGRDVMPVIVFPDGSTMIQPTPTEVANRIGLETVASLPFYDLVIVGGGPAGLAGAVYGASEGLRTLVIERQAPGGQAGTSSRIENYLGFPAGLSGADLARRAVTQARRLGAEILTGEATGLRIDGQYRIVQLADGDEVASQAILLTAGVAYRRLSAPGISRLQGAGVYYGGALSEAIMTKNEDIFIIGAANSAGQAAVHFAQFARNVTMLVRGDSLSATMSQYLIDRIENTQNIDVWPHSRITEAIGDNRVEKLRIADLLTGEERVVPAQSVFIFIGARPQTKWLENQIALDSHGFVLTGPNLAHASNGPQKWRLEREPFFLETNVPGIFVAGDLRHASTKRIATAAGEGAMAVQFVHQYLNTL